MPQKKIVIPPPIRFIEPTTGVVLDGPENCLDFPAFMSRINSNPLWSESWQAAVAQRSIGTAMGDANGHLVISEEDWKFLETAAKNPRTMLVGAGGSGVIAGLGFHPALSGQIVHFQLAIINAETI